MPTTTAIETIPARLMLRISEDPTDARTGVDRQRKLGHEMAGQLGWSVEDVHEDNNRSAWKRDVKRPEFDRLVADIKTGRVRALIAFDVDRISRRAWQAMYVQDLCMQYSVRVAFVSKGREIDVDAPYEWALDSIRGQEESSIKSKRIVVEKKERAESGRSGNRIKYGWQRVRSFGPDGKTIAWHDELHPEHAEIVREITRRFLGGESLSRIARDLDARGVPVPAANSKRPASEWRVATIRKLIQRPANAGLQEFHGKVLPGVVAQASPILSTRDWEQACALLSNPHRRTITSNRTRHLLSLIATCGVCGGPMRSRRIRRARTVWEGYTCRDIGCVGRRQTDVDTVVTDRLIAWLDRIDPAELMDDTSDSALAAAEAETLSHRLADLVNLLGDGVLTAAQFRQQKAKLDVPLAIARERVAASLTPGRELAHRLARSKNVRRAWDALVIDQQRELIAAVFEVVVLPLKGTANTDSVQVTVKGR